MFIELIYITSYGISLNLNLIQLLQCCNSPHRLPIYNFVILWTYYGINQTIQSCTILMIFHSNNYNYVAFYCFSSNSINMVYSNFTKLFQISLSFSSIYYWDFIFFSFKYQDAIRSYKKLLTHIR